MSVRKIFLCLIIFGLQIAPLAWARDCLVYFGTFTNEISKGIYESRLDLTTGKLSEPELAAAIPSPNYLAVSPDSHFLYMATRLDTFKNMAGGAVGAFAIDRNTGRLRLLDQEFSGGDGPCYVDVDKAGKTVFIANYNGGSVKSFHVNPDGTLTDGTFIQHHGSSVNSKRQSSAHAHCFVPAPAGRFALACDLGMDKVMIYTYDPTNAKLAANAPAFATVTPGYGPRHIAFSPDGKTVYVVSEMACTVTVFDWDGSKGRLHARQTVSLLPADMPLTPAFTAAEIAVRPDGRFVYATVRGYDRVSVLAVNKESGNLSLVETVSCGGKVPRGMGIDPTGRWLIVANQTSGDVVVFGINTVAGQLAPTGQVLRIGSPVDVKFVPM